MVGAGVAVLSPMEGWSVVMCGWGRLEAGVLWVVWMVGLVVMEAEPPPQSESSIFPPLLQPAPQPFWSLDRRNKQRKSKRTSLKNKTQKKIFL